MKRSSTSLPMALGFLSILMSGFGSCGLGTQPSTRSLQLTSMQRITPRLMGEVDGVSIYSGGYSGLDIDADGDIWTISDRGPNLEASGYASKTAKRFPLAAFSPGLLRLRANDQGERIEASFLPLLNYEGLPLSGLAPPGIDSSHRVESALGLLFEDLPADEHGIDAEGLCFGPDQPESRRRQVFVCEEYRPAIYMYDSLGGTLRKRYTPRPTAPDDHALPDILLQRQPNLGFEGIAFVDGHLYAALQGPLSPPSAAVATPMLRILRINPLTDEVQTYVYQLDGYRRKVGDMAALSDGTLLVLEHGYPGRSEPWQVQVYAVKPSESSPIQDTQLPPERFADGVSALAAGLQVMPKSLYADLSAAGWPDTLRKPEGLTVMPEGGLLLINDNDFGLDSPDASGRAVATKQQSYLLLFE